MGIENESEVNSKVSQTQTIADQKMAMDNEVGATNKSKKSDQSMDIDNELEVKCEKTNYEDKAESSLDQEMENQIASEVKCEMTNGVDLASQAESNSDQVMGIETQSEDNREKANDESTTQAEPKMGNEIQSEVKCEKIIDDCTTQAELHSDKKVAEENSENANVQDTAHKVEIENAPQKNCVKTNDESTTQTELISDQKVEIENIAEQNSEKANDGDKTQIDQEVENENAPQEICEKTNDGDKMQTESSSDQKVEIENMPEVNSEKANDEVKTQINQEVENENAPQEKCEKTNDGDKTQTESNCDQKMENEIESEVKFEKTNDESTSHTELNFNQKLENAIMAEENVEKTNDGDETQIDQEVEDEIVSEVKCEMKNNDDSSRTPPDGSVDQIMKNEKELEAKCETNKDDSQKKVSNLEKSIIRQVEYYFGNINLPRDKFLNENLKLDNGWIPVAVLLTFKRLSKMTTDQHVIVDALLKSKSNLLEISEDRTKIRRSPSSPLPDIINQGERRREIMSRTVYVKGFPLELNLDGALAFFKTFDAVEKIEMRKYYNKYPTVVGFKGSVFVTFAKEVSAQKFIALGKVTYQDRHLIRMWQGDYLEMKRIECVKTTEQVQSHSAENLNMKPIFRPPSGTVIFIEGLSGEITRNDIKEVFEALGAEIAFIEYGRYDKVCKMRLRDADNASKVLEQITDGKIKIGDIDASVRLIEGEEESVYLDRVVENIRYHFQTNGLRRSARYGKPGRGGFYGKNIRKRKVSNENEAGGAQDA